MNVQTLGLVRIDISCAKKSLFIKLLGEITTAALFSDDSDLEGTSPTGHGSKSSKKERHFWQYNVQAKGPKGQKILIQTKMEDPHVLNEIVDPVFSGDVQMQGIKHRSVDRSDYLATKRH